jgi:nitrile hydratase
LSDAIPPPGTHDLGGAIRFRCTPVEPDEHVQPDPFGKRVDALRQLLGGKGLMTVDEMRRGIESLPEAEYHTLGYYERWLRSMSSLMVEKGVVGPEVLR